MYPLLEEMYQKDVKPWEETLLGPCNVNAPVEASKAFFNWYMEVENAKKLDEYKDEIRSTSKAIQLAMDRCLGLTCDLCAGDQKYVGTMVLATYYSERLSAYSGMPQNDLYLPVTNFCLQKHGLTSPFIGVGSCGSDCPNAEAAPTPVLACPITEPTSP